MFSQKRNTFYIYQFIMYVHFSALGGTRTHKNMILSHGDMPILLRGQCKYPYGYFLYRWRDLNSHALNGQKILSLSWLPNYTTSAFIF